MILSQPTGVGLGLIHLPATVAVSIYFNKKRAFASGVASCGSGIGTLIMAPIVTLLEKNFGWGYAMMMIGALMLVCVPLGLLFKPLAGDDAESLSVQNKEKGTVVKAKIGHLDIDSETASEKRCPWMFGTTKLLKSLIKLCGIVFTICLASNFFMNIGFSVPYVYTVVSKTYFH